MLRIRSAGRLTTSNPAPVEDEDEDEHEHECEHKDNDARRAPAGKHFSVWRRTRSQLRSTHSLITGSECVRRE